MAVTIARTAWIDDDGSGTTGTVLNNAIKTELYNQIDGALAGVLPGTGAWTDVAFNAANFTGVGGGTWTVTAQVDFAYVINGKMISIGLNLSNTTVTTAPSQLRVTIPGIPTFSRAFGQPFSHNQGAGLGWCTAIVGSTQVILYRDINGNAYTAGSLNLSGLFTLSVT